jgi:trehalose 6-phosphate synthase
MARPFVLASNRGPVSFSLDDGELVSHRGAGGLVSGLGPLVRGTDTMWIAAAMSPGDRVAAADGLIEAEGYRIRTLDIDPEDFELAYNTIANETLWYAHHGLYDLSRSPSIDTDWYDAWSAYRRYNQAFGEALVEESPKDAVVLLQDHHLALVAPILRDERPDVNVVHFTHTPFATADQLRVLPELARTELLLGYAAAGAAGFHSARWADDYAMAGRTFLGVRTSGFVSPLGPDPAAIRALASSPACDAELQTLNEVVGDRMLIARTDRLELSKNLIRGFEAFDQLLAMRPDLHDRVVFAAALNPSREGVADYVRYRYDMEATIDEINARWGTADWTPIHYRAENNIHFAMACLRRYDALLVNPIRDGLNLVAKEGPLVNERDGVVLLSREAGAWDELAGMVLEVHPYDITQTAQAMASSLDTDIEQRAEMATDLIDVVESRTPVEWLADQIEAARPV